MKFKLGLAAAAAIACTFATPAAAQEAGRAIVQIYHVAPGQHVAFLKWLDQQDRVAAAAGVARGQLYAHTDGDSWDYLVISPATTEAQDAAIDAAGKKMGINMMRGGIELRKYITSHTDTFTRGPMSAADYLATLGEK
jgi:membrane-bound lytic murein transglycosylase B